MSHEITCPNCQTPNPPGSKFCNNCGHQLPKGTKIICPNCQTPNPRNRFYCDNCGARLVQETLPEEPEPEEKKSDAGVEAFNLPSREPGHTGPLDPNAIPDWLKTGELAPPEGEGEGEPAQEEEPEPDSDQLPPLEEVAPLRKTTDELPDWLVDEQLTSAPPFNPPQEITTDHFLELLQAEQMDDDELNEELAQASADAELPDWLDDVVNSDLAASSAEGGEQEDVTEEPTPSSLEEEEAGAPQEWLTQLGPLSGAHDLSTGDLSATDAEDLPDEEDDAWDEESSWLTERADSEEEETTEEAFEDDASGIFSTSEFGDKVLGGDDLPDWLQDLDPDQTGPLSQKEEETEAEPASHIFESETFAQDVDEALGSDLPEWLADTEEEEETEGETEETAATEFDAKTDPSEPILDDLPDWLNELEEVDDATTAEADELAPIFSPEEEAGDVMPDWLQEEEETAEDLPPAAVEEVTADAPPTPEPEGEDESVFVDEDTSTIDEAPDWLGELSAAESDEAVIADTDLESEAVEPSLSQEPTTPEPPQEMAEADLAAADRLSLEETEEEEAPAAEEEWPPLAEEEADLEPKEGELPEWLTQLDAADAQAGEEEAPAEEGALTSGELPEWLSRLRPSEEEGEERISSLPGLGPMDTELPSEFDEIPDELIGAELPEWLAEATRSQAALDDEDELLFADDRAEIPDWLQQDVDTDAIGEETRSGDASRDELNELLEALPPSRHPAEELVRAELPDWVKAMRPREEDEETAVAEEESAPPSGPLSNVSGAIEIEPIIAEPRTGAPALPTFIFTEEQQQQAALLRQVSQATPLGSGRIPPSGGQTLSAPLRLGLAVLLLALILLGLLGPNLLTPLPTQAPAAVTAVHQTLEEVAEEPVLVAFEYTPAMAGELRPQAELLLEQLAGNENEVIVVSQYPAGLALGDAATADQPRQVLGYLPGDAIGLRELGNCLGAATSCDTITSHTLSSQMQAALDDLETVILLTGDRNSLLNWIEQVGAAGDVTLLVGITQALQPVAQPYLASGQVTGMLAGARDTAVYAAAADTTIGPNLQEQWNAQHLAQMLAAFLLIVGGIVFGLRGNTDQEQDGNA